MGRKRSLIAALVGAALLSGCFEQLRNEEGAPFAITAGGSLRAARIGNSFESFKKTLYPVAVQNCASCHGDRQTPRFAVNNADTAYDVTLTSGIVTFPNHAASRILAKRVDGHCGAGCTGDDSDFKTALKDWFDGGGCALVDACPDSGGGGGGGGTIGGPAPLGIRISPKLIPANITGTAFTTLTYELTEVDPTWTGARFVIEIQLFTGTNAYQLRRPRITLPTGSTLALYVENIGVVLNGNLDRNATTYTVAEGVVTAPGGQFLSASTMVVAQDKGPGTDQLGFEFRRLEKTPGLCRNVTEFTNRVRPVLTQKCVSCHGNGTNYRTPASDPDATVCFRSLLWVQFANSIQSPLIQTARNQAKMRSGANHPETTMNDTDVQSWLVWIGAEAR